MTDVNPIQVDFGINLLHVGSGDRGATFIFERGIKVLEDHAKDVAVFYFVLDEGAFDLGWLLVFLLFVFRNARATCIAAWFGDGFGEFLELVEDDVAVFGALFVHLNDLVDDLFEIVAGEASPSLRVFLSFDSRRADWS